MHIDSVKHRSDDLAEIPLNDRSRAAAFPGAVAKEATGTSVQSVIGVIRGGSARCSIGSTNPPATGCRRDDRVVFARSPTTNPHPARGGHVSFSDRSGITHAVGLTADTQSSPSAIYASRTLFPVPPGPATPITVRSARTPGSATRPGFLPGRVSRNTFRRFNRGVDRVAE